MPFFRLSLSLSFSFSFTPSPSRLKLPTLITYFCYPHQGLEKTIPGTPENETPVHLRDRQIFSSSISSFRAPDRRPKGEKGHQGERDRATAAEDGSEAK